MQTPLQRLLVAHENTFYLIYQTCIP
jgi:hypothetical protein